MDIMGLGLRNINLYASKMTTVKTGFSIFRDVLDANVGEWDLEDMLKTQYPGLKYHVADTSKIDSSLWQRNDYPFEMFFEDNLDNAVLDWKPMSENPSMLDTGVQARLNAARGKYAVIIPLELEEKLKENPELSRNIMNKISTLIKKQDTVPSSIDSFNITLDADGNISNYRFSGGGGEITITKRNGQKSNDEETEEIKEQERNRRLTVKRALARKKQLEKAELDKRYQQSIREAIYLYGQNLL